VLQVQIMIFLISGLVIFLGIHSISIVAPAARDRWAAAMGPNLWRGVYSLISLAGFVLLVHGYGLARQSPTVLYVPPLWLRHVVLLLMLPVFPLLFAAYLPGRIKSALKHPMLVAVKTWALAHLLANGMLADVLLFGGFLAWAVVDRISLKRRVARPIAGASASPWNDVIAIIGGLAVYGVTLLWLHRVLIGVPLL
jgi:uncharacterized membrane protein